jgi:tetratricopeptide (TPR) repeat protein
LIFQAAGLRAAGEAVAARTLLSPIGERDPPSAVIQFELGLCALALGEGRSAIGALSRAVELDPKLTFGWKALEQQLLLAGYDRTADEVRARAIFASAPSSPLREAARALAENRLGDAEVALRTHLTGAARDATGLYLLAEVGLRLDRLAQAEDFLDRCLRLAPGFLAARATRARVRLRRERAAQALSDLAWLLERDPGDVGFRCLKARALEGVADYEGALALSQGLLDAFPDHPRAWLRHGALLRSLGRLAEAVTACRKALELSPELGDGPALPAHGGRSGGRDLRL